MTITKPFDGASEEDADALYPLVAMFTDVGTHSKVAMFAEALSDVEVAIALMNVLGEHGWNISAQLESHDGKTAVFYTTPDEKGVQDTL